MPELDISSQNINIQENSVSNECEWRFITGKVDKIRSGIIHISIEVPERPDINLARLDISGNETQHYKKGKPVNLFLLQPVKDQPHIFHAVDGDMADRNLNPWYQEGSFKEGDHLEGTVTEYVGDYAAIVELTTNLTQGLDWRNLKRFEGFLHCSDTPDGGAISNMRRILHNGDTVQALISSSGGYFAIDRKILRIRLNVNELLESEAKREQAKRKESKTTVVPIKQTKETESEERPTSNRAAVKLLLIDDDLEFCKSWQRLC